MEQAKNGAKIRQFRAAQELKAKEALKDQAKEKVEAETRFIQAKTKASQMKEVALSQATQDLENAQLALDAAEKQAEATLATGKAEATVIGLQNEAEVAGLRKAVAGFANVQTYAQYHLMNKLGPALTEIFASDDSDFGRLFSDYLTRPDEPVPKPSPLPAATTEPVTADAK